MALKTLICITAILFIQATAKTTCFSGQYYSSSSGTCVSCSSFCNECSKYSSNCVTCPPGQYYQTFGCQSSCDSGYAKDEYDRTCDYDGSDIDDHFAVASYITFGVLVLIIIGAVVVINGKASQNARNAYRNKAAGTTTQMTTYSSGTTNYGSTPYGYNGDNNNYQTNYNYNQ
mmetsp:Transcript_35400/g.31873  ORF Transcript_35400/g.31873 Transcript_35400/m.31873 type:complete len:173 (+) Transcript_35400:61-579(+)